MSALTVSRRSANATGLRSLAKREILRFVVVAQQTLFPPLVTSLLFIFIFGLSVGRNLEIGGPGTTYLGYMVPGLLTLHLISSAFENTSSSLFIARWHNHIQEILLSPLSYLEMVLGLLAGGITRGVLTAAGVYGVASLFERVPIAHPLLLAAFMVSIAVIFSCAGLMAALWADNFGMLSVWNIYVITPCVFLGGVFNPVSMLPGPAAAVALVNPMTYLVAGMRYSIMDTAEQSVALCLAVALILAAATFLLTVHLFRIGYKLRT